MLVVRREGDEIRRYIHMGTGNYNPKTARLYTDFGIFSCHPDLGADLSDLFNVLTGFGQPAGYRQIIVAPRHMLDRFVSLIRREIDHHLAGRPGRILAKMNALVHPDIIAALYEASRAGVQIDLIVRGICCLRAGVPGLSETIRVRSIVGRYLEHSRIFRFGSDERGPRYFIGSADLMPRNLDRRVEALGEITTPELTDRLQEILDVNLSDDVLAWTMQPDGAYARVPTTVGVEAQRWFHEHALERAAPKNERSD
jgi:polyphosphate kinase